MKEQKNNLEIAIQISGVRKRYRLGQLGGGSLQADLQSWWARKHGKDDPNSVIGQQPRLVGQTFMALNGIDLTVYRGEALGIIGANGAGKSTLLKLLSRVTAPTDGEIDIYGRITSMLEVGTGFNGEMTGRENIYMNGAILGMTKSEIDSKMEDIIEFSEVREFIDTPVKRYSSGMYVKLAFSVAAHLDSEIMIMDEVLAVGDVAFQNKCLTKMREAAELEGRTVLYVSHNMNTIRQLCDRCVVMQQGEIVFDGEVEDAIQEYMGIKNTDNLGVYYELDSLERPVSFGNRYRFCEMLFTNKQVPVYSDNELIKFSVKVKASETNDNIYMAVIIKNKDNTSICVSGVSGKMSLKNGENVVEVRIPTAMLEEDVYRLHIELITIDGYGRCITFDNPFISFPFRIEKTKQNIVWPIKYYGNARIDGVVAEAKN